MEHHSGRSYYSGPESQENQPFFNPIQSLGLRPWPKTTANPRFLSKRFLQWDISKIRDPLIAGTRATKHQKPNRLLPKAVIMSSILKDQSLPLSPLFP